jgi:hypothetical protein
MYFLKTLSLWKATVFLMLGYLFTPTSLVIHREWMGSSGFHHIVLIMGRLQGSKFLLSKF